MRFHYEITSHLRQYLRLFFPLMRLNRRLSRAPVAPVVTPGTEIVIEGFFRTGNTFAVFAFLDAQQREINIAYHTHAPATIFRAIKLGIPTLVLIREPKDTVLSHKLKFPHATLEQAIKAYNRYYKSIYSLRKQFSMGLFQDFTNDYGQIIERLNRKFGMYTKFSLKLKKSTKLPKWVFHQNSQHHQEKKIS
jgi:hypothetical protein